MRRPPTTATHIWKTTTSEGRSKTVRSGRDGADPHVFEQTGGRGDRGLRRGRWARAGVVVRSARRRTQRHARGVQQHEVEQLSTMLRRLLKNARNLNR